MVAITLPESIVTKQQFARFLIEFEAADSKLTSAEIRSVVSVRDDKVENYPHLEQFMKSNEKKLGDSRQRSETLKLLRSIKKTAPVMHVTFSAEADPASLSRLAKWFRATVSPYVLLEAGIQPGLVAGAYLRSQNSVYDYSLRARLKQQREVLLAAIRSVE